MHPTPKGLRYATTAAFLILSSLVLARTASADPITLAWDANAASDNVMGYKVYVGTQSGIYTQTIDVGNATSYVFPDAVAGQKYFFAVTAYASGPVESLKSTEASGWSNAPPALVSPGNQTNVVGTAITPLQLQGSDPYSEPVSYSATNLPPGLTLQTSTGLITGTGTTAGTYSVTATVRDGAVPPLTNSKTFTWTMTNPTSPPTVSLTAPANGATFTAPATVTVNATASDSDGTITKVDFFAGATLIGSDSTSPYSVTWSNVAAGSYSLTAVATDNDGAAVTSGARTVTVTNPVPTPPPAPWTAADIGGPPQAGSTQYSNGTYTVDGGGEVGGTADQFQFVYRTASGDVDIRARVGSVEAVQAWSKAGVMVRESLAANAAMGMMFISASSGSAFHQRLTTGADRTSTTGTAVAAPYWVRLERHGTTLTASQSADGVAWTTIDTMSMSAASVVVGLAVASGDPAQAATAVFDNVTVTTPVANQAPAVSLTAPASGATFTAPATVTVSATASDTDGTIARVDFFAGTTLIGSDATSPYSITWNSVAAGSYSVTAVATDDDGATTTSAARSITVANNQAPTSSLTAPANGATFTAPASITVTASASDADGTIAKVDFFAGTTLIGSDTTSPYSITWSNVAAGTYSITAVATDNGTATTTSAARTVTVNSPANQAPTASLTAPANGATFTAPASVTVSASASDADGTITKVDFFAGATLIGSDTTSPYSITWNNVAAGSYSLTAVATDNAGATTTSAARTITVNAPANQAPTASLTAPANGATFTAPASVTVSASANDADGTITKVDFFAGATLIGSDTTSPYSITWNNVAAGSYSLTAVATDNAGATATSAARTITVTSTAPPAPWTAADIGGPPQAGSTQYSNGTYTVDGGGEVGGTADQFQFVYRTASGDVDIRARVGSVEAVQAWSKAGVMVRESLAANAAMGMMFISASSGSAFHQRLTTGADRTSTTGTAVAAPYWVRLERRGTTLTASQSVDGVAWTTIGTMSISAVNVVVGLAVASGDPAQAATGTFDNVAVTTPVANQAPTVSLTAPANGATFTAPATVTVNATASDTDGTIAKVDFFAGATLIGTDTTSPYSATWSNVVAGSYVLTAVATDNVGTPTTSAAANIAVNAALQTTVTLSPDPAGVGATLTATVTNGPANATDWVALVPETADDRSFLGWCYLNGLPMAPAAGVSNASVTCMSAAIPGRYQVRLFANNGMTKLATSNTITVPAPPAITISDVSTTEGQTGTKNLVFTVSLSSATTLPVTVRYATSNGTATAGTDYTAASGTLTFTAGATSRTFNVPVIGDTSFEPNETFSITLSQPTNATIADPTALGTIVNDDGAPGAAVALTPDPATVGGTLTATVSNNPGNATDWVGLYSETALDNAPADWCYLNGTKTAPPVGLSNATVTCFTAPASGRYQVRLFINDTVTKIATSNTMTVSGPSGPSVALSPNSPAVGATLSAGVSGGAGNATDWVGLYLETAADNAPVDWCYLNGTKTRPPVGLSNATVTCFTAPASGRYQVRLFINDTVTKVATSNTITVSGPTGPSVALSPNSPAVGATLSAAVSGGPAMATDWVGLYLETALDNAPINWCYLNGTTTPPSTGVTNATVACFTAPASGRYQVRLFTNNTVTRVATSNTITVP